jgi:fatty-acyl-CoA synthase
LRASTRPRVAGWRSSGRTTRVPRRARRPPHEPRGDDLALILYTSGTTATPKGCLHSHTTLLAQGENCSARLSVTGADRLWSPLTFFHVGGWQGLMIAWARGACYSHVGFFTADVALDQLERERCTIAFPAFEPIWLAVLGHPRFADCDLSALRIVINVAVPESLRAMQAALPGTPQVSCIGMTEAGGSICMGSPQDDLGLRTQSSGRPLPNVEVRAIDSVSGKEAPVGTVGELLFRSPSQFLGYFGDAAKSAEVIDEDGWVRTGDLVVRDERGAYRFVSRLKDMLKVGGENVAAVEIERYLVTHPAVALAAVVRAPDGRYGEVPAAFVQLAADADVSEAELIEHCLGHIATFKIPRYVRFVGALPTTGSGKVQKLPLELQIAEELRERGITEAPKLVAR